MDDLEDLGTQPLIPPPAQTPIQPGSRVRGVKFALTYPQCDTSMQVALGNIMGRYGSDVKWCVVAEEKHADGSPHLHVALYLEKRLSYTDHGGHFWDFVVGKKGNYQKMRNPLAWLRYVIKDGRYVSSPGFDPKAFLSRGAKKKGPTSDAVARLMLEGERNIIDLTGQFPGFMLRNLGKVEAFKTMLDLDDEAQKPLASLDGLSSEGLPAHLRRIVDWIKLIPTRRTARRQDWRHLRIEGPTGLGKSSLLFELDRFLRVYSFPYKTDFFCSFDDAVHDLVVFDEFRSQVTPTFLNQFSDGLNMNLRRKGLAPRVHKVMTPCILLSNYTWEYSYPKLAEENPDVLRACIRRFETVQLSQDDFLFPIIDRLRAIEDPEQ